jgi:N-glycosylase/DNA lyase
MTYTLLPVPRTRNPPAPDAGLLAPGPLVELAPEGWPARHVAWGQRWHIGAAAYWIAMTEIAEAEGRFGVGRHRLGDNLGEEVAACMLGGYGMPHEVGLAAYDRVRASGALDGRPVTAQQLERLLTKPLTVGNRFCSYRFPRQRAARLAAALAFLRSGSPPSTARMLRDWLLCAPGVGPKTAAWVVRNHLDSDDVAIIDVHVQRAGTAAGVFDPSWTPQHDYYQLESFLLAWARVGGVSAADLDAVIWAEQATAARLGRNAARRAGPEMSVDRTSFGTGRTGSN